MINVTEKAQSEIKKLLENENRPGTFLRMGVKGGGCSGLSYDVRVDDAQAPTDRPFEVNGLKIVCDIKSLLYLDGMTVDYSTDLVNAGFRFTNPNAAGSCGCGTSFSV